jgi:hypothetical protein
MGEWMYRYKFSWPRHLLGEWSASRPCLFNPWGKARGTHWMGGWVGLRAGLDDMEKRKFFTLTGLELRPLGRSARSQSLYRLRYPGSCNLVVRWQNLLAWYLHHSFMTRLVLMLRDTWIWSSGSGDCEGLLSFNAMYFGERPQLRRNIWPPSSGSRSKPRKKPAEAGNYMFSETSRFLRSSAALQLRRPHSLCPNFCLLFLFYRCYITSWCDWWLTHGKLTSQN